MQRLKLVLSFSALSGLLLLAGCNLALPEPSRSNDTSAPAAASSSTMTPPPNRPPSTQVPDNVWVLPCRENMAKNCSQMEFDTAKWEVVPQEYSWSPKLVHRAIEDCEIVPSGGRGLRDDFTVEHDVKTLGSVQYELFKVSQGDELQFINYWILAEGTTASLEVRSQVDQDVCIQDAEAVLATQRILTLRPKG